MQNMKIAQKYQYGFRDDLKPTHTLEPGLSKKVVEEISSLKNESDWMRKKRLQALEIFSSKPVPTWGADLSKLDFDALRYYVRPTDRKGRSWDEVPVKIKRTFDRIGVPQAERAFLAGVEAQYDSEAIYGNLKKEWEEQGIIFCDTDTAVQKYPEIVKQYFGTVVPAGDNKFAALNSAVWSGGSFVYVPAGKSVTVPLQAYFRINQDRFGQFERTLIIAEEGSTVHYVEGCTAPIYRTDSLHAAVVEVIVKPGARVRYTTIQNWSNNIYNLVTKRAFVYDDATMEWVDGNLGCVLAGEMVYTEHGPRPIETIEPGTLVWSFDTLRKEWVLRRVVARKESGKQKVYKVTLSNGRSVHLTASHPLLALDYDQSRPKKLGRYSLRWVPLDRLSVGSAVVFPTALPLDGQKKSFIRPQLTEKFVGRNQHGATYEMASHARLPTHLPDRSDNDVCWFLGLWLAEGDYTIKENAPGAPRYGRVGWSVPGSDRARRRLMKLLKRYVGRFRIEERKDNVYLRVNSLEFALWLRANGFTSGAYRKRVPGWAFTLPADERLSLLAGYLDGDGYARRTAVVAKSVDFDLLSDIQMLAALCDVHAGRVHSAEVTTDILGSGNTKTYTTYRLDLTRTHSLLPFLSSGLRTRLITPEKVFRYHETRGARPTRILSPTIGLTRIVAIRPSLFGSTYDLEIAGSPSFVVNGVIVHNSKVTMKYPSVFLWGKGARGDVLSVALAGKGQHQDAGAKAIHLAPFTSSTITSKSVSQSGGKTTYRGQLKIIPGAKGAKSNVRCDALILDGQSASETIPVMNIMEKDVTIGHEASVGRVSEDQLFYLMSRGINGDQALCMIVNGFIEPITKELPLEYAVELNRLIRLEMEGSVG